MWNSSNVYYGMVLDETKAWQDFSHKVTNLSSAFIILFSHENTWHFSMNGQPSKSCYITLKSKLDYPTKPGLPLVNFTKLFRVYVI